MLRIEARKGGPVQLLFRKGRFKGLFFLSLATAVGLHLLALFIFSIPPSGAELPYPLSQLAFVSADPHLPTAIGLSRKKAPPPPPRDQFPPPLPLALPWAQLPSLPLYSPPSIAFERLRLHLSGPLAEQPLLAPPSWDTLPLPEGESRLRCRVWLDQRTGRLFGWIPLEGSSADLDAFLPTIRFATNARGAIISGVLEIERIKSR